MLITKLIDDACVDWTDFNGKLKRKPFWINIGLNIALQFLLTIILLFLWKPLGWFITSLLALVTLGCLTINFYSLIVRRLHDAGKNGWWLLLFFLGIFFMSAASNGKTPNDHFTFGLLMVVTDVILIYLLCLDSKKK
jgi:uncharacterized membrane protein YhaH (DUF805 family)